MPQESSYYGSVSSIAGLLILYFKHTFYLQHNAIFQISGQLGTIGYFTKSMENTPVSNTSPPPSETKMNCISLTTPIPKILQYFSKCLAHCPWKWTVITLRLERIKIRPSNLSDLVKYYSDSIHCKCISYAIRVDNRWKMYKMPVSPGYHRLF